MATVEIFQHSPEEDDGVFYEEEPVNEEDDECFSSSHLSGSEGNADVAYASSGNIDCTNANCEAVEIPPIECWFHGRINRGIAEKLMTDAGLIPGSYLVRESDRRPRNYVLTFVSSSRNIFHFQINAVCGHYFISQHVFSTLADLVKYFSSNAVIGGTERLVNPIPPENPVELAKRKVITLVPFCSMKDTDELSFMKGDVLVVHEDFGNGWLWATSERSKESGLVYSGLTEDLAACCQNPEKLLYVHTNLARQDALAMLAKEGAGGFLVTPSESSPGNYTLLVNCGRRVERFQIQKHEAGYEIGGRLFGGLHDIITRYSQASIWGDVHLTLPIAKHNPVLDNNNLDGDLYQKLRSNRLDSKSSCPDAIKSGYLDFKARKRWKNMYFLLKDTEGGQLFCYENEKRTKPKIVLDLFCCTLYLAHRSLFNLPYCFELIQSGFDVALYFRASTAADYDDWVCLLRPLCCGCRLCPSPFGSQLAPQASSSGIGPLRKLNCITIRIDKARFLPAKANSELSAIVSLNDAKICRTGAVACNVTVVWDEKFTFEDLPCEVETITVAITSLRKRSREVKLGTFKISVACDERDAFTRDDWFDIQPAGTTWRQTNAGQCHVIVNYCKEIVLPLEEYRSLADLLGHDSFALCRYISDACTEERQKLAEALLLYYESEAIPLIISEIKREIVATGDARTLFRSGSLAVALIDELMLREGWDYATTVLKLAIETLLTSKLDFEIDHSKAEKASSSNITNLLNFTASICDRIFDSAERFPKPLRYILANVKEIVSQQWSADPLVGLRAVSSFVFLRLFCLILVLPRQYQLLSEKSPPSCYRNLLRVATVLQGIANLSDVAMKRDCDALVEFSGRIRPKMIEFLNAVSAPTAENDEIRITTRRQSDPARYLAAVFHICEKHVNGIRNYENKHPAIKNLLSVVELLSCHEKRYVVGPTVSVV